MPGDPHLSTLQDLEIAVDAAIDLSVPRASLTDADLLRRANLVAAIPRDDQPSFAAACGKDEEMHRLALELAATKLPLALNRNLCMFTAPELICCTEPELPMPLPLFFALLSAHATLCSCLVNRGASEAERCQIQRAALPILHGIVQASGAGYGYGMAGRAPWPEFYASYACLFLDQEVEDEKVLREVERLDMDSFFDGFVYAAEESGAVMCTDWLERIMSRRNRRATSDGGK